MLLKRLYEYSERLPDLAPPMYAKTRIRWLIDLDRDGKLQGPLIPLEGEAPKPERGKLLDAPALPKKRAVKISAQLLADNGQYVLGITPEGKNTKRTAECHSQFVGLIEQCASETSDENVSAVHSFLEQLDLDAFPLPTDFNPTQNITFRVDGEWPIDSPAVRQWWADHAITGADNVEGQCLITGRRGRIVKRTPQPIKGIPGGQSSGLMLISANNEAFESYAREASLTSPVSLDAAERFGKALNALLRDERTHLRVGPLAYVFWTRGESDFSPVDLFRQPTPEAIKVLIKEPVKGSAYATADEFDFYASALSASGGRAVVRDWIETTIGAVKRNLARWFSRMRLGSSGRDERYYGVFALAASLFRDVNRENPNLIANTVTLLMRGALLGTPLPDRLLAQVIGRNHAEQGPFRKYQGRKKLCLERIAMIKLVLLSQMDSPKEDYMTELELSNRDPAYLCGRLLAVLEGIQRLAIPGATTTILDRYYGTASSAPATVFGTLLRGAQAHLAKLRKTRKPAFIAITRRLEEITEHLPEFPRTLTLMQQALFSLGYYHQRAYDRAQATKHKELADTAPDAEPEEEA